MSFRTAATARRLSLRARSPYVIPRSASPYVIPKERSDEESKAPAHKSASSENGPHP